MRISSKGAMQVKKTVLTPAEKKTKKKVLSLRNERKQLGKSEQSLRDV